MAPRAPRPGCRRTAEGRMRQRAPDVAKRIGPTIAQQLSTAAQRDALRGSAEGPALHLSCAVGKCGG
eukprot:1374247-Alexandrium_andersonii.AAC.1